MCCIGFAPAVHAAADASVRERQHEMLVQYKEHMAGTVYRELALNIGGGQSHSDERLILNRSVCCRSVRRSCALRQLVATYSRDCLVVGCQLAVHVRRCEREW